MYQQHPYGTHPQSPDQPFAPAGQHPGSGYAAYGYPASGTPAGYAASLGAGQSQAAYATGPAQGYPQVAYPHGYPTYTEPRYQAQTPFFNFSNERFIKGLVIGAAAAYLLTNESVQRGAIKGLVKLWSAVQGGVAEVKERFHDAEAELRAAESDPGV